PDRLVLALPVGFEGGAAREQGTGRHHRALALAGHRDLIVRPRAGVEIALQAGLVGDLDVPELRGAGVSERVERGGLGALARVFGDDLGGAVAALVRPAALPHAE